jgi:predicted aspartyl protease
VSFNFNAKRGLIIVQVEVFGPSGSAVLSLALDTGATGTMINQSRLMQLGYDPAAQPDRLQITTGSGVEFVPRVSVSKIAALGQARTALPVLCHTLPPSAGVDGLLGLDFFRGQELIVNFRTGQISLS